MEKYLWFNRLKGKIIIWNTKLSLFSLTALYHMTTKCVRALSNSATGQSHSPKFSVWPTPKNEWLCQSGTCTCGTRNRGASTSGQVHVGTSIIWKKYLFSVSVRRGHWAICPHFSWMTHFHIALSYTLTMRMGPYFDWKKNGPLWTILSTSTASHNLILIG